MDGAKKDDTTKDQACRYRLRIRLLYVILIFLEIQLICFQLKIRAVFGGMDRLLGLLDQLLQKINFSGF